MLMANEIVPRPLDFFYNDTYANPAPRAAIYDEAALAEIRRLEVTLYHPFTAFPRADLVKVET
jgi:hypothetical protein